MVATNVQTTGGFSGIGTGPIKALNAVAATGDGPIFALGSGCDTFTVQLTTTGTPSAISVTLKGSIDGTNFVTLGSAITATGLTFFTGVGPVPFVRLNLGTLTAGTAPTVTGWICGK